VVIWTYTLEHFAIYTENYWLIRLAAIACKILEDEISCFLRTYSRKSNLTRATYFRPFTVEARGPTAQTKAFLCPPSTFDL
jgi:hypothetical protein